PEIFYGRTHERASLVDPFGACFIYGGRQLGKTALLRDVARTFDDPSAGRIALWIDLKSHMLGYDRSIDGIWGILATELKRSRVLPSNVSPQIGAERLLDQVQNWLSEDSGRRSCSCWTKPIDSW